MTDPTIAAVADYIDRGWTPIPLRAGRKRPDSGGWTSLTVTDEATWLRPDGSQADRFVDLWSAGQGVGVHLGPASGGLVDVDLDCPEAIAIAGAALPPTLLSGRQTSASSHRWYEVTESDWAKLATTQWIDPLRKRTDPKNAMMVEVRWQGAQTVVPPTPHEDTREETRWETPFDELATIGADLLMENAHLLAAASLLARYWPPSGARHHAAVALCGCLLGASEGVARAYWQGDSGAGDPARSFLHAVAAVGGDTDLHDRLAAIPTTMRRVLDGKRVQGWPTLAELYGEDAQAVWQAKEWIDKAVELSGVTPRKGEGKGEGGHSPAERTRQAEVGESQNDAPRSTDHGGGQHEDKEGSHDDESVNDAVHDDDISVDPDPSKLVRVDLAALLRDGVPPIEYVLPGLIVKGQVHTLVGYPGVGKSLLTMWMAHEIMRDGGTVLYIDEENGEEETVRRVESLGIQPKLLRRMWYFAFPGLNLMPGSGRDLDDLHALVEDIQPDLVVIDSMVDLLHAAGLSQNENDEVAMLYKQVIEPFRTNGHTLLLHDHLAKHDATRTKGAGAKDELVQVVWSISTVEKFDREHAGQLKLTRRKDRTGGLPQEQTVWVRPTGDGHTRLAMAGLPALGR